MSSDILAEFQRATEAIEAHREGSKRTILCHPDDAGRIRAAVERAGLADVITVAASALVPAGQMYVVNDQAISNTLREAAVGRWSLP